MSDTLDETERDGQADLGLRGFLTLAGGFAGAALWVIVKVFADYWETNGHLVLTLATFLAVWFSVLLVACGPLRILPGVLAATIVAVPAAFLQLIVALRYAAIDDLLSLGLHEIALAGIVVIGTPFVIAGLRRPGGWTDYPSLFIEAWTIVMRSTAAGVFTGIFWAVIFLSNLLLSLVGIGLIDRILDFSAAPLIISGALFGLSLAVIHEYAGSLAPHLVLRLFRLVLPPVLVVSVIFLVAVPFRGLSDLFGGGISSALVMMCMTIGALTLVTTAVDQDDGLAVAAPWMRLSARIMALLTPLMAGLAVYAVWIRVADYGWTPERLAALTAALILLLYGIAYAVAALRGAPWMALIRRSNVVLALVTLGIAVLWLTPVLNAERISARSQLARLEAGRVDIADFDFWRVGRAWGHASEDALEALKVMEGPDRAALDRQLEVLAASDNRYEYMYHPDPQQTVTLADVLPKVVILPEGADLPAWLSSDQGMMQQFASSCRVLAGEGSTCVMIVGDFAALTGDEVLFVENGANDNVMFTEGQVRLLFGDRGRAAETFIGYIPVDQFRALRGGDYRVEPVEIQALKTGDKTYLLVP